VQKAFTAIAIKIEIPPKNGENTKNTGEMYNITSEKRMNAR
jgi:hypothetical protein